MSGPGVVAGVCRNCGHDPTSCDCAGAYAIGDEATRAVIVGQGRVVIAGGPRVGKSTLAYKVSRALGLDPLAVQHTDELVGVLPWGEDSAEVATWYAAPGPWVVEGVAAVRALRKWLRAHPAGKPCDLVWLLERPHVELTRGQAAMAKGLDTVWREIAAEVLARGVLVRRGLPRPS